MSIIKLKSLLVKEDYDPSKRMEEEIDENTLKTLLSGPDFSESAKIYDSFPSFGLYRGFPTERYNKYFHYYTDPSKEKRRSKDTNNFYTEFLSDSPNWSGYPLRNRSVIGSTSENTARTYGNAVYYVVPQNGAKFVVCDTEDCWGSFQYAAEYFGNWLGVDTISRRLSQAFYCMLEVSGNNEMSIEEVYNRMDRDYKEFLKLELDPFYKEILSKIDELYKLSYKVTVNYTARGQLENFFLKLSTLDHLNSFTELLNDMFDPEKNKIKLVHGTKEMTNYYSSDREFWTDSPCLLVSQEGFREIITQLFS